MKKFYVFIFAILIFAFVHACNKKTVPPEPPESVLSQYTATQTTTVTQIFTQTETLTITLTEITTPTFTATETITPTFTPIHYKYSFDEDTEGWVIGAPLSVANPASLGFTWAGHNTDPENVFAGTGSYAVDVNMTNVSAAKRGDVSKDFTASPIDVTARTLTVKVKIPSGLESVSPPYCIHAFIATASESAFSIYVTITASGWQEYIIPLPVTTWSDAVEYVGLRMRKTNGTTTPDWAGRIYLDEIEW